MAVIRVSNIKKYFGKTKAVDDISFDVNPGEIMGFLGPNGAGKTTTIRCMLDFLRPDSGSIMINGKEMHQNSAQLKQEIGFLSGEVHLYHDWTVKNHLDFVRKIRQSETIEAKLLDILSLDPSKKFKDLSSGNKQKLGLILALMHQPKILILDEPTNALDPLLQQAIYDILRETSSKGTTIFMSSHNLAEVEKLCHRVAIIKEGKLVATENISELKKKKLYTVNVFFKKKLERKKLEDKDIEIIEEFEDGYGLLVKKDINLLLDKLEKLTLKDLEIQHANLEHIFLEYYKASPSIKESKK